MTDTPDNEPTNSDASEKKERAIKTAGVAVGIGSAAIVAALLYANRKKKKGEE